MKISLALRDIISKKYTFNLLQQQIFWDLYPTGILDTFWV